MDDRSSIAESYPGYYPALQDQVWTILKDESSGRQFRIKLPEGDPRFSFAVSTRNREPNWVPTGENITAHLNCARNRLRVSDAVFKVPGSRRRNRGTRTEMDAPEVADKFVTNCSDSFTRNPTQASYEQTFEVDGTGYDLRLIARRQPFSKTFTSGYDIEVGNPVDNCVNVSTFATALNGQQISFIAFGTELYSGYCLTARQIQEQILKAAEKDPDDLSVVDLRELEQFATSCHQTFRMGTHTEDLENAGIGPISVSRTIALSRIPTTVPMPLKAPPRAAFPQGFTP